MFISKRYSRDYKFVQGDEEIEIRRCVDSFNRNKTIYIYDAKKNIMRLEIDENSLLTYRTHDNFMFTSFIKDLIDEKIIPYLISNSPSELHSVSSDTDAIAHWIRIYNEEPTKSSSFFQKLRLKLASI